MTGRGRGRGRGTKSPKKPAKKSSSRKKAPPNPTPNRISHLMMNDEELDRSPSPAPVRSPSAFHTSRPSSPVSSIAGDDKGPGEGPA